jgi:hypothetical protein
VNLRRVEARAPPLTASISDPYVWSYPMTLIATLSDGSRPRIPLHTLPGFDVDLATDAAVTEIEVDTGLVVIDWELS